MPDYTLADVDLEILLDKATIKYGETQDLINNLTKNNIPGLDLRPPGTSGNSTQNKQELQELLKKQQDIKAQVLDDAEKIVRKSPSEKANEITEKAAQWKESNIYQRYEELKALQKNPTDSKQPEFLKLLAEKKENITIPKNDVVEKAKPDYQEIKKDFISNKKDRIEPEKPFSMSARWEESLGYKDQSKEPTEPELDKTQRKKDFLVNEKDITEKTFSMSDRWEESLGYNNPTSPQEPNDPNKSVEPREIDMDKDDD